MPLHLQDRRGASEGTQSLLLLQFDCLVEALDLCVLRHAAVLPSGTLILIQPPLEKQMNGDGMLMHHSCCIMHVKALLPLTTLLHPH